VDSRALEEVIAKVRRLYALANKNASEHEAAAALAAAEKLIQQYRLSSADLETGPGAAVVADPDPIERFGRRVPKWLRMLISYLAVHYGCATYRTTFTDGSHIQRVFGRPDDIRLFRLQYDRVKQQIARLTSRNCKGRSRTYHDSYRKGMVATIGDRLAAARAEARQEATTAAIVKVDARFDAADAALKEAVPELRPLTLGPLLVDGDAYRAGRRDGQHVHLGEELGEGKSAAALPEARRG
jgi:hypothetical protein